MDDTLRVNVYNTIENLLENVLCKIKVCPHLFLVANEMVKITFICIIKAEHKGVIAPKEII
jgi:hypothetical protein